MKVMFVKILRKTVLFVILHGVESEHTKDHEQICYMSAEDSEDEQY